MHAKEVSLRAQLSNIQGKQHNALFFAVSKKCKLNNLKFLQFTAFFKADAILKPAANIMWYSPQMFGWVQPNLNPTQIQKISGRTVWIRWIRKKAFFVASLKTLD